MGQRASQRRIAVAMSGGVDSSVVAHLLRRDYPNAELFGIHMSNWDYHVEDENSQSKCVTHLSLSMIVCSLCAIVSTVHSLNCSRTVC